MPPRKAGASRLLVVDSTVLHACGGKVAAHPTSKRCRDALETIRRFCHRIIMTDELGTEWKRHRSNFAATWLATMWGMKKVERNRSDPIGLDTAAIDEPARQIALKDLHLVEAALATDRIIVSLDKTARNVFAELSHQLLELSDIIWVDPSDGSLSDWLTGGTPAAGRTLGDYAKTRP